MKAEVLGPLSRGFITHFITWRVKVQVALQGCKNVEFKNRVPFQFMSVRLDVTELQFKEFNVSDSFWEIKCSLTTRVKLLNVVN